MPSRQTAVRPPWSRSAPTSSANTRTLAQQQPTINTIRANLRQYRNLFVMTGTGGTTTYALTEDARSFFATGKYVPLKGYDEDGMRMPSKMAYAEDRRANQAANPSLKVAERQKRRPLLDKGTCNC